MGNEKIFYIIIVFGITGLLISDLAAKYRAKIYCSKFKKAVYSKTVRDFRIIFYAISVIMIMIGVYNLI